MGVRLQRLVFTLIFFATATLTLAEIHRAKGISKKHAPKLGKRDYVAGSTKDILKLDISEEAESKLFAINTWMYSVCCAVLVGLSGIFPLLIIPIEAGPSLKHGAPAARLKLLLSFAVGGLLGDVFLHLLPEAWQHLNKGGHDRDGHISLGLWVITGMLSFLIIEKIFAKEDEFEHLADECEEKEEPKHVDLKCHSNGTENARDCIANRSTLSAKRNKSVNTDNQHTQMNNGIHKNVGIKKEPDKKNSIKISGYLNLTANVIDNFTHGLAVAGGFLISNKVGCITTLAILLHEIPHEVGDFAILLRSGFDRWSAAKAQLLTATGGLVGALTALTADSAQAAGESTAWILPFTSGGFIYIALVTIVPDVIEEKHARESTKQVLCLLAGIGVMYLVTLVQ